MKQSPADVIIVLPDPSDNTGFDKHTSLSGAPSILTFTSNAPSVASIVAPVKENPSTVDEEVDTASNPSDAPPDAPVTVAPVISNWKPPTASNEL